MAMPIDAVDLLCRRSNAPADLLTTTPWTSVQPYNVPHVPGLLPTSPSAFLHQLSYVQPHVQPLAPVIPLSSLLERRDQRLAVAAISAVSSGPPGLGGPPGFDPYSAVPAPVAAPVHAWALEAKLKADQASEQQRLWAEKMQLQYMQGQGLLKALQEKAPESSHLGRPQAAAPQQGAAFERLVKQMGLTSETPRGSQSQQYKEPGSIGQTPPSKRQAHLQSTPPKEEGNNDKVWRRKGEKENLPSPAVSQTAAYPRRNRGGRWAQSGNQW